MSAYAVSRIVDILPENGEYDSFRRLPSQVDSSVVLEPPARITRRLHRGRLEANFRMPTGASTIGERTKLGCSYVALLQWTYKLLASY